MLVLKENIFCGETNGVGRRLIHQRLSAKTDYPKNLEIKQAYKNEVTF